MTENPISVEPDLSLSDLAENYILSHHHSAFPVTEQQTLLGLVQKSRLIEVPRDEWPRKEVRSIMVPVSELPVVSPENPANDLLKMLTKEGGRILVSTDGNLKGIISRRDLFDYIALEAGVDIS